MSESEHKTQSMKAPDLSLLAPGTGFDTARLVVDGRQSEWSLEQFKAMSLVDRVRLLAAGDLRFYRKGVEIPGREALKAL